MKTLLPSEIPASAAYGCELVPLGSGLQARIECKHDESMGEPWKEHDGHGVISEPKRHPFGMGSKPPKKAGEKILYWDSGQYRTYDIAATMALAKADGWGLGADEAAELAEKLGRTPTAGDITAAAVERDFECMRDWCCDKWHWIGVCVTLEDADGAELGRDSTWGIESDGEYWRDVAADLANQLAEAQAKEVAERAHWEARDTVTV